MTVIVMTRGELAALRRRLIAERKIPNFHVYSPNLPEYPGRWVAKLAVVGQFPNGFTGVVVLADSLKEMRDKLPPGMVMVTPDPFDDPPALEEIWV